MTWLDNFPDNVEKTAKIICNSECVNENKKVTKIKKNTKSKKPSQRKFNLRIQSTRISDYMNLNKKYQEELDSKINDENQKWYGDRHTTKTPGTIRM